MEEQKSFLQTRTYNKYFEELDILATDKNHGKWNGKKIIIMIIMLMNWMEKKKSGANFKFLKFCIKINFFTLKKKY